MGAIVRNAFREDLRGRAPLYEHLETLAGSGRLSFHMPGMRGARPDFTALDTTELAVSEDLNEPGPVLREAQAALAAFYQMDEARFLTGGATEGLRAAIDAITAPGDTVIVARSMHRFIVQAAIEKGLRVVFARTEFNERDILPHVSAEAWQEAVEAHPEAKLLIGTACDYFGDADADPFAALQESGPVRPYVLLDAAHAACFPLIERYLSADIAVYSAHKTLPALTGTAYLLFSRLPRLSDAVDAALTGRRGSSPPLYVAASGDYARAFAECEGREALRRVAQDRARIFADLDPRYRILRPGNLGSAGGGDRGDPLHLCIDVANVASGIELAARLGTEGIDIEMADLCRLLLLGSLQMRPEDEIRLVEALNRIAREKNDTDTGRTARLRALDLRMREAFANRSLLIRDMRERSVQAPVDRVTRCLPLRQAVGQRAAAAILPYPPGIALVWPGEALSAETAGLIEALWQEGIGFHGLQVSTGGELCAEFEPDDGDDTASRAGHGIR